MRPVAIIGIGKTAFGAFPDRDLRSLAVEAGEKCLADGHVSPSQVEAYYLGNFAGPSFVGQNHLAPYIAGAMGITGVPAATVLTVWPTVPPAVPLTVPPALPADGSVRWSAGPCPEMEASDCWLATCG